MNAIIKLGLLACSSLIVSACSNTFSGADDAYLKNQNTAVVQSAEKVSHYQAPAVVPPGESLSIHGGPTMTFIGPGHSVLAIQAGLSDVWGDLAAVLAKTPYSIMDHDEGLHTYFIVDKVKTGGVLKRTTPIYQLELSHHHGVTELHLVNTKHQPVEQHTAHRVMKSIQTHYTKS